jgi:hypothetical protein
MAKLGYFKQKWILAIYKLISDHIPDFREVLRIFFQSSQSGSSEGTIQSLALDF